MDWTKLTHRLPDPDEQRRVLVYTEDVDFGGEQVFDMKTDDLLNGLASGHDEVIRHATHWTTHPSG